MTNRFRFIFVAVSFASLFGYLIFNLYSLQIKRGEYYISRAASQYKLAGFLEPHRGIIYFTDKDSGLIPVALNKSYPVIFAVPQEIEDAQEAANQLVSVLDYDKGNLFKDLSNKKSLYKLLVKKADNAQVKNTQALNLTGVYVDEQEYRFYPFGRLAAHLLGFISPTKEDDVLRGRYGIEYQFDERLRGVVGEFRGDQLVKSVQGEDLVLTIDKNIQSQAEDILRKLVADYHAEGGLAIVQNPSSGDILALTVSPNYDPNEYSKFDLKNFLNPVNQAIYEPGSIFKIITMAVGLDAGVITPATTYYDQGFLSLNGRVIRNWDLKANGTLTMTEVIERSVNTGSAFAAKLIGRNRFHDYLIKFGFNKLTGLQLPEEVVGDISNLKSKEEINLATVSFGQGISVTPIALINAVSAIANGGRLIRPNLLKGEKLSLAPRIISEKAAKEITVMMVSAVDKAKIASIPNYLVAGKTGTAQVPDFKRGGYSNEVINTYIGFAPASNPRFTIMVRLDKPVGAPLAGLTVVPAFRELAEFILNYYNIPPDNL